MTACTVLHGRYAASACQSLACDPAGLYPQKKKHDNIEEYPECYVHSKRIMEGLRSINIVCSTSIGHTKNAEIAIQLFRAAMNYRHDVFSPAQKEELERIVRGSKLFKVIIEEKEREKAGGAKAVEAPASVSDAPVSSSKPKVGSG